MSKHDRILTGHDLDQARAAAEVLEGQYPFKFVEAIISVVIRCRCTPNTVLCIHGVGDRSARHCPRCGRGYRIGAIVYNSHDPQHANEVGVQIEETIARAPANANVSADV